MSDRSNCKLHHIDIDIEIIIEKGFETMTTNIDNLTEKELEMIIEKYNLKKSTKKDPDAPSFQVIRGRAIRRAAKEIASRHRVPQKVVNLLDTHKVKDVDNTREFEVLLECKNVIYKVDIVVEIKGDNGKIMKVEKTTVKSL